MLFWLAMPHHHIVRTLPPVQAAFAAFKGFASGQSKQRTLLHEMRRAAKKLRKPSPVSFYSMREVADFFSLPLRTVAIVYEQLEREGLLNRLRGSQTMLAGKKAAPRTTVRGVVGLPFWLFSVAVSPYGSELLIELGERFRKVGFVTDFIFFRTGEDCRSAFAERMLHHNLDLVIWQTPHQLSSQVLLSLHDRGVRQIIVQSPETPLNVPATVYHQNWHPAYQEMAKAWAAAQVRKVFVPKPAYLPSHFALKGFSSILNASGISVEIIEGTAENFLEKTSAACSQKKCAIAFMDLQSADSICNSYPQQMETIAKKTKVGFCRGRVRIPYFFQRGVRADVIAFSPSEIAQQLVEDFSHSLVAITNIRRTFTAVYQPEFDFAGESEQP